MVEPKILVLAQEGVGGHVENVRQALDVLQTGIGAVAFPILDRCNADARSARQFLLREFVLRAELGDLFADHGITSIAIPYTTTGKKRVVIMRLKLLPLPIPGRNGCLLMSKRNSSPSARRPARRSAAADSRPSERWMEEGGGEASSCRPRKAARHAQGKKPHPGEPVRARKHQRALPAEPGNAGLQSIPCPRCTASAGRWAQPSRIFCFLRRRKIHHNPTPYQQEG